MPRPVSTIVRHFVDCGLARGRDPSRLANYPGQHVHMMACAVNLRGVRVMLRGADL
jgi:hypothetical protein